MNKLLIGVVILIVVVVVLLVLFGGQEVVPGVSLPSIGGETIPTPPPLPD